MHRTYQLINFYISQNRIQEAQNLLNDIPQNFELSNSEQTVYEKNSQFYNIKFNLKNTGKSWFEMNDEQRAVINDLAQDSTASAGMKARAVLSLIEGTDYGYPIPEIEQADKSTDTEPEILPETFDVYPEFAKDYFIIEYALAEKKEIKDVNISIFNENGKEIKNFEINTYANQFLIECEDWKPGRYFCRKFNKGKIVEERKVIIKDINSQIKDANKTAEIYNPEASKTLELYPNPAKNYFFVKYNLKNKQIKNITLQITDTKGVIVKEFEVDTKTNIRKISTSDWKKGVYTISLISDNKVINTLRLVVE